MAQLQQNSRVSAQFKMPLSLVKEAEEQRAHPRLELNSSATFRNAAGHRCKGQVVNISPDGLQVRCNSAAGQLLHPKGGRICPNNAPIVQIEMHLQIAATSKRLVVGAQLIYVATCESEPNCILGFQFLELRPTARKLVDSYFQDCLSEYFDDQAQVSAL